MYPSCVLIDIAYKRYYIAGARLVKREMLERLLEILERKLLQVLDSFLLRENI